ncbi:MAG: class I SAM-dependent methyltransferase [Phycisphaerales bacterium]
MPSASTAKKPPSKKKKVAAKRKSKKAARRKSHKWLTAATADRHVLYERAVQDPEAEVDFVDQVWKERRGKRARTLREDFCGTAIASCAWVKRRHDNHAWSVDIDPAVLEWARTHLPDRLTQKQFDRLNIVEGDVLTVRVPKVETIIAMNFSYFLFKTRKQLRAYFTRVFKSLENNGIFILDAYGGSEAFAEMHEERDCDGFTYIWDQHAYNPITGDVLNHIHFRFPDGTEMLHAFSYDWRLWTLPEIRELLAEAGFASTSVYWEGYDDDAEAGNGEFAATEEGEACEGWIAYIVAEKSK